MKWEKRERRERGEREDPHCRKGELPYFGGIPKYTTMCRLRNVKSLPGNIVSREGVTSTATQASFHSGRFCRNSSAAALSNESLDSLLSNNPHERRSAFVFSKQKA
jgi:hypothetical protein